MENKKCLPYKKKTKVLDIYIKIFRGMTLLVNEYWIKLEDFCLIKLRISKLFYKI